MHVFASVSKNSGRINQKQVEWLPTGMGEGKKLRFYECTLLFSFDFGVR